MGTLEKVLQMKKEGLSEGEIISKLKNERIPPMEINDALNQSKIKEAIGDSNPTSGMVPSIMGTEENESNPQQPTPQREAMPQDIYTPQEQYPEQSYGQPPMQSYPMPVPEENQYYEDDYSEEEGEQYSGYESSSDTIIEIAEQVFSEKIKKIEKQVRDVVEFKTLYSTRIDEMNERLKRMEKYFDKMQMTIIDKVGGYGKELDSIKKEMEMIEDSFGKLSKK